MARQDYLLVVPLRCIDVRFNPVPKDLFQREWTLLGKEGMDELEDLPQENPSLRSNIKQIRERLDPDALLLVRYREGERDNTWDESKAETILAALAMALLLTPSLSSDRGGATNPLVVFRARYREHCDLPLAFDNVRVRLTGHSVRMGLLRPRGLCPRAYTSTEILEDRIRLCPPTIAAVLEGIRLTSRQKRLKKSMRALQAAFQSTSAGGFLSSALSAAEVLVSKRDDPWARTESRLEVVVGELHTARLAEVVRARHDYVHASIQPQGDTLAISALAVAVQAWTVMHTLYERLGSIQDCEKYLDCCRIARSTTSSELAGLRDGAGGVPRGAAGRIHWVRKYLLDLHPNDYGRHHVVLEVVNCPDCDHLNRRDNIVNSDNPLEPNFECARCNHQWQALDCPDMEQHRMDWRA